MQLQREGSQVARNRLQPGVPSEGTVADAPQSSGALGISNRAKAAQPHPSDFGHYLIRVHGSLYVLAVVIVIISVNGGALVPEFGRAKRAIEDSPASESGFQ